MEEETHALKETTRWQKWISLWPKRTSQQTFGWGSVKRWRLDSTSGGCWYVKLRIVQGGTSKHMGVSNIQAF